MDKIVVSGSVVLQRQLGVLLEKLHGKYEILDYPKPIPKDKFVEKYSEVHKSFYESICKTDVLLIANFDNKGIKGYIGAAAFAELAFGLALRLVYGQKIDLYILRLPSEEVACYDEIKLWIELGWVKVWID